MEKHPLVVFVTKRHEYAVQGYGIAFRYLVKSLDQTLFAAAMDAVLQELNSKHFTIEYDGVTMSLETSDIYFLESHGHKVLIHCKEQDLTLRMSIPEALEQLPKRCFFTLIALVEVLAMLLIGLRIPDTDILMQAVAARLVYVVFSNLIQVPLVVLISHFFSRKGNALRILWLLPIIAIQIASIAVCYVAQYHAADEYFPDFMVGLMAVLLLINILIVFYVEALRENELEKFKAKFNEQQYNLQMEYYQQLKERQEEVRSLRHDVKKYILAMQAVAEHGDTEELHKIAQAGVCAPARFHPKENCIFLALLCSYPFAAPT